MGYGMGWSGGLYKGIKWSLQGYLWACLGVFVGVVWYYMGLYLYKSGEKYRKMGVFCGFLVAFLCGSGWSFGKFRGCGGCKGV